MALRVWLPLNGNLNNQGLSDLNFNISGTPVIQAGKLGNNYYLDGSSYFSTDETDVGNFSENFSMCIWFKSEEVNAWTRLCGRSAHKQYQFDINSAGKLRFWTSTDGTDADGHRTVLNSTNSIADNLWHHACGVCDGTKLYLYIDGILNASTNYLGGYSLPNAKIFIGMIDTAAKFKGMVADFRLYDEALSPKQVKEISRGLVAHYKLEGTGANPNLIRMGGLVNSGATSVNYDNSTDTYTIVSPVGTSTWGYGVNIGSTNKVVIPYNQKYRMSCEVWVPTEHKLVVDYNNYSNDSTVASWNGNDNDLGNQRLANSVIIPANTWTKVIMGSMNAHTSNTTQTAIYEASKYGLYTNDDTEPTTWYLRHFKVELGDTATDWIPNTADAAYTTLGYDNMIARDVSGNGYNGTVSGTLSYNSDSPRYSGSTNFSTPGYIHYLPSPINSSTDAFTFSCWFYPTQNATMALYNDRTAVGDGFSVFYLGNGIRFDTGSSAQYQAGSVTLNAWNFITCVFDKNNNIKKTYINGSQVGSTSTIGSLSAVGAYASIGASSVNDGGGGNQMYGSISDVRIYSTALTTDDILTLYKTSGIIDNKGNVYAYEFKEE